MTDEPAYGELIMPFVTVQSKGGPHEDNAYVCGWEMATLDAQISASQNWVTEANFTIRTENAAQADLLAMRYGYVATIEDSGVEGWSYLTITKGEQ